MIEHILSSSNFLTSLIISLATAAFFIITQFKYHSKTMKNLELYKNFFDKNGKYETLDVVEGNEKEAGNPSLKNNSTKRLKNVADRSAELYKLIDDINDYLASCKGTATFNIIQNKTERRITKMYDKTVSKSSFPTHYGLMGTFVGVFLGLGAFLYININSTEGITDEAIQSLILGVLVSMSTSFIGLILSTRANDCISNAKNKIDEDKNDFYEYIQNKLMPSVDLSLTEALGNLHQTVTEFEPSFTKVIDGFKKTFNQCTIAFGDDFRESVRIMVGAVGRMSDNIEQITTNVDLLEQLLDRVSSAEWTRYMRQFADASDHFKELTQSLNDFERARRMMLAAAQEAINIQKTYNDSLTIPREVAININSILQRVVKFEQNINALGENLAATQMLGNVTMEEIQNQIKAIKVKHKVAEQYIETSNNKLEMFFNSQLIELKRLEDKYMEALIKLFEAYEKITDEHKDEINQRHEIFKAAIEDKFELSEVRAELSQLKKLPIIDSKIDEVKNGQAKLQRTNDGIRKELNAFNAAKEEENKGAVGRFLGGSNSAVERELEQQKKENKELEDLLAQAKRDRERDHMIREQLGHFTHGGMDQSKEETASYNRTSYNNEAADDKIDTVEEGKNPGILKRLFGFGRKDK